MVPWSELESNMSDIKVAKASHSVTGLNVVDWSACLRLSQAVILLKVQTLLMFCPLERLLLFRVDCTFVTGRN